MSEEPRPLPTIEPLDEEAMASARQRWATRAKPAGSLGRIEDLAVQLAGITGAHPPPLIERPAVVVFAADHGVAADGASAWPSEVTGMMAQIMGEGRAAINTFAGVVGAEVHVVDVGVAGDLSNVPGVLNHKVRAGTASIAQGAAMSREEAAGAVEVGRAFGARLISEGVDCLIGGEMGIGNTTPSAALIGVITRSSADEVTGAGAGLPPDRLAHKRSLVQAAIDRGRGIDDPMRLLAEIGGLEIAALAGLYVGSAAARTPFIVDGVIAAAAACVAEALAPGTAARAIAGHRSSEPAARIALDHLGLDPLLDLGLRLGEGTGACLAVPLLNASAAALNNMADLPGH